MALNARAFLTRLQGVARLGGLLFPRHRTGQPHQRDHPLSPRNGGHVAQAARPQRHRDTRLQRARVAHRVDPQHRLVVPVGLGKAGGHQQQVIGGAVAQGTALASATPFTVWNPKELSTLGSGQDHGSGLFDLEQKSTKSVATLGPLPNQPNSIPQPDPQRLGDPSSFPSESSVLPI